jgi:hypothetical protein
LADNNSLIPIKQKVHLLWTWLYVYVWPTSCLDRVSDLYCCLATSSHHPHTPRCHQAMPRTSSYMVGLKIKTPCIQYGNRANCHMPTPMISQYLPYFTPAHLPCARLSAPRLLGHHYCQRQIAIKQCSEVFSQGQCKKNPDWLFNCPLGARAAPRWGFP